MTLPMFEPKKTVSLMIKKGKGPDVESEMEIEAPDSDFDPGMKACAEDILAAIESKSVLGLAAALQAAIDWRMGSLDDDMESSEMMDDEGY